MDKTPFTEEEVEKLRRVAQFSDVILGNAEYARAEEIIVKRWRGAVIGFSAVIIALAMIWDKLRLAGGAIIRWFTGG